MKTTFIGLLLGLSFILYGQNSSDYDAFVFNKLSLNSEQKDIVKEINKNRIELTSMLTKKYVIENKLDKLSKIKDISGGFSDINKKTDKNIENLQNDLSDVEYDIESLKEITYNLAYKIYTTELQKNKALKSKHKKEIKQKASKSKYYASKANKIIDELDVLNENTILVDLKQANEYAKQAVNYQEQALGLLYDFEIPDYKSNINNANKKLLAASDTTTNKDIAKNNTSVKKDIDIIKQADTLALEANNLVFKIQIGAFVNEILEDEFKGLQPLTKDANDQYPLTKYMIGNYASLYGAEKAINNIIRNTKYKDAFIVCYKNGHRIPINTNNNNQAIVEYSTTKKY